MITLEVHICDQRRSYIARFSTEAQALDFVKSRNTTHAFHEVEAEPLGYATCPMLLDWLYPQCEHGLSASNCYGPQHYYFDEEEQARGLHNG
jgi:hypothetical protein